MTRPEILDTAKKCVCGDREQDYGTPEQNFDVIAQLWTAYKKAPFTAVDVAVFQALVKIGRISSGHGKADNWIDLAGYAACGGEIESGQNKPTKEPYDTYLEEMGEEDVGEPQEQRYHTEIIDGKPYSVGNAWKPTVSKTESVKPVKGKYDGLSDGKLRDLVCEKYVACCEICPLFSPSGGWSSVGDCNTFDGFREIAIAYLTEQDKAKEGRE